MAWLNGMGRVQILGAWRSWGFNVSICRVTINPRSSLDCRKQKNSTGLHWMDAQHPHLLVRISPPNSKVQLRQRIGSKVLVYIIAHYISTYRLDCGCQSMVDKHRGHVSNPLSIVNLEDNPDWKQDFSKKETHLGYHIQSGGNLCQKKTHVLIHIWPDFYPFRST